MSPVGPRCLGGDNEQTNKQIMIHYKLSLLSLSVGKVLDTV